MENPIRNKLRRKHARTITRRLDLAPEPEQTTGEQHDLNTRGYVERWEPSMEAVQQSTMAQATGQTISRAEGRIWAEAGCRMQEADHQHQRDTLAAYAEMGLWVLVWVGMMYLCEKAARASRPDKPTKPCISWGPWERL